MYSRLGQDIIKAKPIWMLFLLETGTDGERQGVDKMQKVLLLSELSEVAPYMGPEAFAYICQSQIESFEGFETFNLLTFHWYDIHSRRTALSRILIYIDKSNLFFICHDQETRDYCAKLTEAILSEAPADHEQLLCRFFGRLFRGDMEFLDQFEAKTNDVLTAMLSGKLEHATQEVIARRQELLRLKRYYEQLDIIFDEIAISDSHLLSAKTRSRMQILGARTDRYLNKVCSLQELVSQIQETYQSQLSIQQNNIMKIFTIITAIFLPLTLLVGWYGMNFAYMPELHWRYGYPLLAVVSVGIVAGLIAYFKHKKWL